LSTQSLRATILGLLAAALLAFAASAQGGATQADATIRGKAISTTGQPVADAKVTLTYQMPGSPPEKWAATTSAAGTFNLTVPAPRSLGLAVEPPPGGKLAPCALMPQGSLMVAAGQTVEVTIYFAPATARLTGSVADPDKRPVAGATVSLGFGQMGGWFGRSATTDASGKYEIAGLAPGGYVVRSVEPRPGTALVRLSTWKPGGVRAVALADGQTATEDFALPRGGRLTGRVLDEKGKPLPGAAVSCRLDAATEVGKPSVYQMSGQWYSGEATTDEQGRYNLGGLTQETYCVEAKPPEGLDLAPAALRGISTPLEGDVKLQDIALYKGATLVGKVVGADDKPVADAEASISIGLGRFGSRLAAKTDPKGAFTFRGLPSGKYSVTVQPPQGSTMCQKQFDGVGVLGGFSLQHTLKLPLGAQVTGTVVDPDGQPVAGATVMARFGYSSCGKATSDKSGRFTLVGIAPPLQPGPARRDGPQNEVIAVPPDDAPCLATGEAPLPDVAPGGSASVDVALKSGVAIAGRIAGPDGKPVPGCQVSVHQLNPHGAILGFGSVVTGDDGRYLLKHLAPGKMYLAIQPPGGSPLLMNKTADQVFEAGKKTTVDVALGAGATLVGEVLTSKGKPVTGAQINLQPKAGGGGQFYPYPPPKVALSGVGGAFRIEAVAPGTYDVVCTCPDPTLRARPDPVTIEGTGEHKTKVIFYQAGSLAGTVCDGLGKPLGQGTLWLSVQTGEGRAQQQAGSSQLDEQGRYRIGGLAPGQYTLTVGLGLRGQQLNLARPGPTQITIEEGKETKHDLKIPFSATGKPTQF
jgi:protocatechuate 3,4-dioxygenase beta subunit